LDKESLNQKQRGQDLKTGYSGSNWINLAKRKYHTYLINFKMKF